MEKLEDLIYNKQCLISKSEKSFETIQILNDKLNKLESQYLLLKQQQSLQTSDKSENKLKAKPLMSLNLDKIDKNNDVIDKSEKTDRTEKVDKKLVNLTEENKKLKQLLE